MGPMVMMAQEDVTNIITASSPGVIRTAASRIIGGNQFGISADALET